MLLALFLASRCARKSRKELAFIWVVVLKARRGDAELLLLLRLPGAVRGMHGAAPGSAGGSWGGDSGLSLELRSPLPFPGDRDTVSRCPEANCLQSQLRMHLHRFA